MTGRSSYPLFAAGLLTAMLAACSHDEKKAEQAPPKPPTAAQLSQKSFQSAAQEQQALSAQQSKVDASHAAVLKAQDDLARAQAQEQQERARAQQLQEQANMHMQEGVRQAQRAQAGLQGMGSGSEALQSASGTVTQATPSQLVIRTQNGRTLTFAMDNGTRVIVGSESRSVADIQRGADAQVAYDSGNGRPTALVVRVTPAGGGGSTQPQRAPPAPEQQHRAQQPQQAPSGQ